MTYDELEQILMDYYNDTSRTTEETLADLQALGDKCSELAAALEEGEE